MSPLKKVLMTLMILGAMGTTVGAGTFASFNASTQNSSATFATGTIVLQDSNDSTATTCLSTGVATSTDVNSNASCTPLFTDVSNGDGTGDNAWLRRPGDVATVNLSLKNMGSLAGTLKAAMPSACTYIEDPNAQWNGTSTAMCSNMQYALQEYSDAARTTPSTCWYGPGKLPAITGTAVTLPVTYTSTNNKFKLVVNGTTYATNAAIATGTYSTIGTLAAAVQTAARAVTGGSGVLVSGTPDNRLTVLNNIPGSGTSNIGTLIATTNNGLASLGWTTGVTNTGNATTCTLGTSGGVFDDSRQTLGTFFSSYPTASPLDLGSMNIGTTRWFRLTLILPVAADTQLQGKLGQFSFSWTLIQ